MMTNRVLGYLGSAALAVAMLGGCSAQAGGTNDEGAIGEDVTKTSDALMFRAWEYETVWSYETGTLCKIEGYPMRCCPNQQTGFVNFAIVGVNGYSTLKCARLEPANGNIPQLFFQSQGAVREVDGVTGLACPAGKVMVAMSTDFQKIACVTVSPNPLVERATPGVWDGSTVTCDPAFPNPNSLYTGEAMTGLRVTGGLRIFCGK